MITILLVLTATAVGAAETPATDNAAPRMRVLNRNSLTIVAFGDSVTFGAHMQPGDPYPEQLQRLLCDRYGEGTCRVINAGVGGNTTGAGLARLERDVLAHRPDIVLINFGLNDSVKTGPDVYTVPLGTYRANLIEMVRRVRQAGSTPILSTITPAIDDLYFDRHPREFYEADGGLGALLSRYSEAVAQVAREEGVLVADWRRALSGGERELIRTPDNSGARDGVHPTPAGYRALAIECFLMAVRLLEG
ncbi:MAG: hypothetical protein HPY44_01485 [Armatimonadetes bacterium]|nr:hypothetical protein [Armatimonadota bacterium]